MEVSNIVGTFIERKEGKKTINKLHVVQLGRSLKTIDRFLWDNTLVLHNLILYWRYGPNQARFRAYKEKNNQAI